MREGREMEKREGDGVREEREMEKREGERVGEKEGQRGGEQPEQQVSCH